METASSEGPGALTEHPHDLEKASDNSIAEPRWEDQTGQQQQQRLTILVFRGDPIDAPQYRHTALFIENLNQEGAKTEHRLLEVVGSAGFFEPEEDPVRDPRSAAGFVGSVVVATIPVADPLDTRLREAIWSAPINNAEYSWNCQNWVGDSLISCAGAGLIPDADVDIAIDGMVNLVLQARDEA